MQSPSNHESKLYLQRLRPLGLMWMIRPNIDLELLTHLLAELILREHAPNGDFEDSFRMTLQHFFGGNLFEAPWPAGVMAVELVFQLVSSEDNLFCVDDDNVIAHINERSISRLVLTHQDHGSLGRKPANRLAVCVDEKPTAVLLKVLPARNECAHDANLRFFRKEDERKGYEMGVFVVKLR